MPKIDIFFETLIQQLHSADWNARCDAAWLLGQSGDPRAVNVLLADLKDVDVDWRVRRNAPQALGALRDPRATQPLLALLKDRTMTVRQRAIVALGRIKDLQALPTLLEVLLEGKQESYEASKAIRKFGKKALPEIVKAFERSSNQDLLLMLVDLKYGGVFELLLKLLESDAPASRQVAIQQLGKLADDRAIPYLIKQLDDNNPTLQSEAVVALGILQATEAIPALLELLKDDELYGPSSGLYHAVTESFQIFGEITDEMQNAFPGKYPAMFNMGSAPLSLPEVLGLLGNQQPSILNDALSKLQTGFTKPDTLPQSTADSIHKAVESTAWKFGVMLADARDAKQERLTRLITFLKSESSVQRIASALSLPWYGEQQALEPLHQLRQDPEKTVQKAATWAASALQKVISYRNQFGM